MNRLRKLFHTKRDDRSSDTTPLAPTDEVFFRLIDFHPWDDEQRNLYRDDLVLQHIQQNPDCCRAKYTFPNATRGSVIRYPLSRLVALGASIGVVKLAYKANPSALTESTYFGSTPLHAACVYNAPLNIIKYLLSKEPSLIRQSNRHGYTPLHLVCESRHSNLRLIQYIYKKYPEAIMLKNKLGNTPLETAISHEYISEEIRSFLGRQLDHSKQQENNPNTSAMVSNPFTINTTNSDLE